MRKDEIIGFSVAVILLVAGLISLKVYNVLDVSTKINTAQMIEIIILFALVLVTAIYVKRTSDIADATKQQAKEMREQRVMSSRPVIIQKAVIVDETEFATEAYCDWFSYFEVYNAGNGPAIEVEISLLNKEKTPIHSQRKTFLRAGEPPIEFSPSELASLEKSTFYLVCEYQSILSHGPQPTWYQTWLPFETIESSEAGKIYVKPGELEFKEVSERERIDAFGSRRKPK